MILEIDTSILDKIDNLSINQLVLLSLVLNNTIKLNQEIHKLLSLVNEEEIQDLVNRDLLIIETYNPDSNNKYQIIKSSPKLYGLLKTDKTYFDIFYDQFPVYVTRPDGTKGFLRSNKDKCRKEYNRIVKNSKLTHDHIIKCLKYEIDNKMMNGKMGYMKTMWKWLTQHEWEIYDEQINLESETMNTYGTELI